MVNGWNRWVGGVRPVRGCEDQMGGKGYGYGGGGGAEVAPMAEEVQAARRGTDAGVDTTPEVGADRGSVIPEPVAEKLVEFVVVMTHTYLAVVYFQQFGPGGPGGPLAVGYGLLQG